MNQNTWVLPFHSLLWTYSVPVLMAVPRALPKCKWKRCQLKRILLVWFICPPETNFKKYVAMLYVLVNLWTKSYGTTSDKTTVQFRAIKLSFLKRRKSPPPTPYSILFWSKYQHWEIRRGTKTVLFWRWFVCQGHRKKKSRWVLFQRGS